MVEEFISPSFIGTSTAATAEGRHPTRQSSRNINPYFSRLFIFQYQITPILTPSPRFYCPVPDIFFHTRVFAGRRQMAQQHPHRPHRNRAKPADDVGARLHGRGYCRPPLDFVYAASLRKNKQACFSLSFRNSRQRKRAFFVLALRNGNFVDIALTRQRKQAFSALALRNVSSTLVADLRLAPLRSPTFGWLHFGR